MKSSLSFASAETKVGKSVRDGNIVFEGVLVDDGVYVMDGVIEGTTSVKVGVQVDGRGLNL